MCSSDLADPRLNALADHAAELVRREFTGVALWGIKDPRLCRLQPFWERAAAGVADEVHAVHVFRHPLEVADSLHARNGMPPEQSLLLWLFHNLEAVLHPRQLPLVSIPVRSILEAPSATIAHVLAALGAGGDLPPAVAQAIGQLVEPALLHHRAQPGDPRLDTPAGALAGRCHDCLERQAAGTDVVAELEEIRSQLLALVETRRRSIAARACRTADVIVPVYAGFESTMRCIDAVLQGGGDFDLLVINDASPDVTITQRLQIGRAHV